MTDFAIYDNACVDNEHDYIFSKKEIVPVPDACNGVYQNAVVIDFTNYVASKMPDYANTIIQIPTVMVLAGVAGTPTINIAPENVYAMSMKSGFHHCISAIQVDINGSSSTIAPTGYNNLDTNFKLLSKMSMNDYVKLAPSYGIGKDSIDTCKYKTTGDTTGIGECNTTIADALFTTTNGFNKTQYANKGRRERMMTTSCDPQTVALTGYESANLLSTFKSNGKPYCDASVVDVLVYYGLVQIRLGSICDLLEKLPFQRNMSVKITLFHNLMSSVTFTQGTLATMTSVSNQSAGYGCIPFQISPQVTGQGWVPVATKSFIASIGICKGYSAGSTIVSASSYSHPIPQVRAYVPCYEMTGIYEEKYFGNRLREVIFNDFILCNPQQNIQAFTGNVQAILTNGIVRPRYMLIYTHMSAQSHGLALGTASGATIPSVMMSPFSSAPATCSPYNSMTNLQVTMGGNPVFASPTVFKWEQFMNEIRPANNISGILGVNVGIISQQDWESGLYGFIYVDLSRHVNEQTDNISQAINVNWTNASPYYCDYTIILGYERQFTLDVGTGMFVNR